MNSSRNMIYRQLGPGILLGIVILFGLMILGDVNKVSQQFLQFKWGYFGLALLLTGLNYVLRFVKRQYSLHHSGIGKLSFSRSIQLFIASFPLSVTPMKVGESFKGIWFSRLSGLPVEKTVMVFLADHFSDGLSIFLLSVFGTIAFPDLWPFFLLVFLLFLCAIIFMQIKPMAHRVFNLSEKMPFLEEIIPAIRKCMDSNPELFHIGPLVYSSFVGLLSWVAEGAALTSVLLGLGFLFSWELVGTSLLVFSFAMLMGILSSFPSGVGVMEVSMAALLTIMLGYSPDLAAAATILFRIATFWVGFLIGLLIWVIWGKKLGINIEEGRIIES
jgi:glycosyltransferase 2 family protein